MFQVSENGFVMLGLDWKSAPPRPQPVPLDVDVNLIAPLWTDTRIGPNSNVWYKVVYKYSTNLTQWTSDVADVMAYVKGTAGLENIDVQQAVVLTWEKMTPPDSTTEVGLFKI